MERDYGKEIDGINEQLGEIKELLAMRIKPPQKKGSKKSLEGINAIESLRNMHPDKRLTDVLEELCMKAYNQSPAGYITYMGSFSSGDRQSCWISPEVNTNKLLKLIESNAAAKVLTCIGNNDRLNMLLALLRTPRTVAQLVEDCGYNTTGQVYHHLKPLLAADLVAEDEHSRGSYVVQPPRVQGIIMLLAGISDMLDTKYTQGDWEPKAD